MRTVNAVGDACPIPVVKTKRALETLEKPDMVEVLVDNETAVQNVTKFAVQAGKKVSSQKLEEHRYQILIDCTEENIKTERPKDREADQSDSRTVVVVSSDRMGSGDEELGTVLMKGFLFALTQLTELPGKILFYNGGARLTCKGSESVEDLKAMERQGVEILTCGTCLDYYGLKEKLEVGGVTNMYTIVETMNQAGKIVRP